MTASSFVPGTTPVLHLLASPQSPLPLIQRTVPAQARLPSIPTIQAHKNRVPFVTVLGSATPSRLHPFGSRRGLCIDASAPTAWLIFAGPGQSRGVCAKAWGCSFKYSAFGPPSLGSQPDWRSLLTADLRFSMDRFIRHRLHSTDAREAVKRLFIGTNFVNKDKPCCHEAPYLVISACRTSLLRRPHLDPHKRPCRRSPETFRGPTNSADRWTTPHQPD